MERAHFAVTLYKRQDLALVVIATAFFALSARLSLIAESFIRFNNLTDAAKHTGAIPAHGFASPVSHEPRGFIGNAMTHQ